jgi:hypothetical protein
VCDLVALSTHTARSRVVNGEGDGGERGKQGIDGAEGEDGGVKEGDEGRGMERRPLNAVHDELTS